MRARRVVLLSATELRHRAFRKVLAAAEGIDLVGTLVEDRGVLLEQVVAPGPEGDLQREHLLARTRSEEDVFGLASVALPEVDRLHQLRPGELGTGATASLVDGLAPDIVLAFGCAVVTGPLLERYAGRFVNLHLGLSPYYRGAGTNFWPLVDGRPELVGATFHHLDAGIDSGAVIDQIRARVHPGDTPHLIGNRLIADAVLRCAELLRLGDLSPAPAQPGATEIRYVRRADFDAASVRALLRRFEEGLVADHLAHRDALVAAAPISHHPGLSLPPS